ncbi:MAG: sensor histidine kinase [Calditrichia bacterium]
MKKIFVFILLSQILLARNLQYKQYTVEHGLKQSQVTRIHQLPSREMIFATVSGMSIYDGVQFTNPSESYYNKFVYSMESVGDELWIGTRNDGIVRIKNKKLAGYFTTGNGLLGDWVNDIHYVEDKIIIGTNKGIQIISNNDTVVYNRETGMLHDVALDIYVDSDHNIWFTGFYGFGVITPDGEVINVDGRDDFRNAFCEDILVDSYNHVWVATREGLLIFDRTDFLMQKKLVRPVWLYENQLKEGYFTVLKEDKFKDIWIGTKHGVIKYEYSSFGNETRGQIYSNRFIHFQLKNLYVRDIFMDLEDNIWLGTRGGGVFKIQGDIFWSYGLEDGLLDQEILTIFEDVSGKIWVGNNRGCASYDGMHFTNYTTNEGLPYGIVTTFFTDSQQRLWAGTWRGIARFENNNFIPYYPDNIKSYEQLRVFDIIEISDSLFWLATDRGLCEINIRSGNYNFNLTFPELKKTRLWEAGRLSDSLIFFVTSKNVYTVNTITNTLHKKHIVLPYPDYSIYTAKFLNENTFVVGGNFGLLYFKNDSLRFHFQKSNYLLDQDVISAVWIDSSLIWVGTNTGVTKLAISDSGYSVQHFGSLNGFYGEEIITNHSMYADREGNIWFGTFLGLSKYIKYKDLKNELPPKVYIKSLRIFRREVSGQSSLNLSYRDNTITIKYLGISFRDERDVLYRYRLRGYEDQWSQPTSMREANYYDLPSGDYTFEVLARNRDGVWSSSPATISFTIAAPFWETPQFIAMLMLVVVLMSYFYFKSKIQKVRKERDVLEQKVVARTKTLIEQQKRLLETNKQLQTLTDELQSSMAQLKKAQVQLIQSEKMASLGTLIAGVTHELNNPITFIYSNFEALKDYIAAIMKIIDEIKQSGFSKSKKIKELYENEEVEFILDDMPQLLKGIEYGANRIKDIVAQLYRFSHPGQTKERINIHEQIDLTLELFLNQYRCYISIHKEYGEIGEIDAPAGEINQVILNILINAAHAIRANKGEGKIDIKTWQEDGFVCISVKDDGGGIPENIKDRIFDPFFTTKSIGEGTGLGLSLCYNILQNLKGDISHKNVDGGAEFIIRIPVTEDEHAEGND